MLLPEVEKDEAYFQENQSAKKQRLNKAMQRYAHEFFFQKRFDETLSYFCQKRMIEYPSKAWANDRRICTSVDSYKNK